MILNIKLFAQVAALVQYYDPKSYDGNKQLERNCKTLAEVSAAQVAAFLHDYPNDSNDAAQPHTAEEIKAETLKNSFVVDWFKIGGHAPLLTYNTVADDGTEFLKPETTAEMMRIYKYILSTLADVNQYGDTLQLWRFTT